MTGPGQITRGWMPCSCAGVRAAGKLGHLWVKCRGCEADGRRRFYYEPVHVVEQSVPNSGVQPSEPHIHPPVSGGGGG